MVTVKFLLNSMDWPMLFEPIFTAISVVTFDTFVETGIAVNMVSNSIGQHLLFETNLIVTFIDRFLFFASGSEAIAACRTS